MLKVSPVPERPSRAKQRCAHYTRWLASRMSASLDAYVSERPLPLVALVGCTGWHRSLTSRTPAADELHARYLSLPEDTTHLDHAPGASAEHDTVVLKRDWLHKHTHVVAAIVSLWFQWDADTPIAANGHLADAANPTAALHPAATGNADGMQVLDAGLPAALGCTPSSAAATAVCLGSAACNGPAVPDYSVGKGLAPNCLGAGCYGAIPSSNPAAPAGCAMPMRPVGMDRFSNLSMVCGGCLTVSLPHPHPSSLRRFLFPFRLLLVRERGREAKER